MNVYDSQRMADALAPEGYVETATPDDADLVILNTCHIREKAAEKVYSELGRLRVLKDDAAREGRRVTVAVAGCVAQAEGAEIIRRAPAVDLVVGPQSYHRLPDLLARAAHGKVRRHRLPGRGQVRPSRRRRAAPRSASAASRPSSPCRKAATSSAPSASCPTRAAPKCRGRSPRSSPRPSGWPTPACARSRCSARTSTPITARTRTAAPATLGRLLHRLAEIPGIARLRYTTSHPRDMDDEPDRGASRPAGADAVPASAGAVRLRPHPRGDEPPPHAARTICASSSGSAPRGPTSRSRRDFIVGFPGRDRRAISRDTLQLVAEVGYRQRLLVQIFAAARHARRRHGRPGAGSGEGTSGCSGCRTLHRPAAGRVQRRAASAGPSTCCSRSRAAMPGQIVGRSPYLQPVQVDGAGIADRRDRAGDRSPKSGTNSLFGTLANARQSAAPALAEAMLTEDMGA